MLYLIPLLIAIFLAINMGASGTAPSFSAAYGSGIIKRGYIPLLFGLFVLLGAIIAGEKVIDTIGGAVLPAEHMSLIVVSIVLLSSALSIFFANILKVPQSTSQSTVFALVGCAVPLQVLDSTRLLYEMVPTWLVMPLMSFVITYGIGYCFLKSKKKASTYDFKKLNKNPFWKYLTIACSCYVAFSIGSNNVANSAGPLVSLVVNEFDISGGSNLVILFSIIFIAPWFGIGSAILGHGVTKTVGQEIIQIGVLGATLISIITATLLLLASTTLGVPTSLVQMNTFAVIALGILKTGPRKILSCLSLLKLFFIWIVAPILAFAIAYVCTNGALKIGLLTL